MAKQLPIIARTNKSGFELLTVHKCQTLVLPDDDSAPDCDVALTLQSEAQELVDGLFEALVMLRDDCQTPIDMYERNGPEFTSPQGNEYESTSHVMAKFAELVASIDVALSKAGGEAS